MLIVNDKSILNNHHINKFDLIYGLGVFNNNFTKYWALYPYSEDLCSEDEDAYYGYCASSDNYEEIKIWCDLHGLTINREMIF